MLRGRLVFLEGTRTLPAACSTGSWPHTRMAFPLKKPRTFLHEDVDVRGLSRFLSKVATGEISVAVIGETETPTPLASIALEEMSRKGEVMDPNRLKRLAVEGAKVRVLGSSVLLVCTNCWKYTSRVYVSELRIAPRCPVCGSQRIAVPPEDEEKVERLARRLSVGMEPSAQGKKLRDELISSGRLVEKYGTLAVMVLAYRLKGDEAESILSKHVLADDDFFSDLVEYERRRNLRRFIR